MDGAGAGELAGADGCGLADTGPDGFNVDADGGGVGPYP